MKEVKKRKVMLVRIDLMIMFDNGAERSYIRSSFVKRCKPQWVTSATMPYLGGHNGGRNEHRNECKDGKESQGGVRDTLL